MVDYNSKINITKEQWIDMISNKSIFKEVDINLILLMYVMDGRGTAKEFSFIDNKHTSSYNLNVVALSKRVLEYLYSNLNKDIEEEKCVLSQLEERKK